MAEVVANKSSTEDLEVKLAMLTEQLREAEARSRERGAKIANLRDAQSADETTLRNLKRSIARTQNALFARAAVSAQVRKLRAALLAKLERVQSDHITIAKKRSLASEIAEAAGVLQRACAHPFVFSYDGYGGSQSSDWDDKRHGYRVCTICNKRETSAGTKEDIYRILSEGETRLVRRDLRPEKDRSRGFGVQEWFSIELLEKHFEHSAGSINVEWLDEADGKKAFIA